MKKSVGVLAVIALVFQGTDLSAGALQASGGNFNSVQSAAVDQGGESVTLLVSSGPQPGPSAENRLSIVRLGESNKEIIDKFKLRESFEILPILSMYSDAAANEYIIAHNTDHGTMLRWFDNTGRQQKEQLTPLAGGGVFGISKVDEDLNLITDSGIERLLDDGSAVEIFSVGEAEFIGSHARTDDEDCPFVIAVVDQDYDGWRLQVLCHEKSGYAPKHDISCSPTSTGGVVKVLRVSDDTGAAWVVGDVEGSQLSIAECHFGEKTCKTIPVSLSLTATPMVATHRPIKMISDDLLVVMTLDEGNALLSLVSLEKGVIHQQKVVLSKWMAAYKDTSEIAGVDLFATDKRVWVLEHTISIGTNNPDESAKQDILVEIGFGTYRLTAQKDALEVARSRSDQQ